MGGFDNVSPAVQISIGVLVGILSTSVQSLGLTLQRKSHLLEDDRPAHLHRRPPHRRRMWQVSFPGAKMVFWFAGRGDDGMSN